MYYNNRILISGEVCMLESKSTTFIDQNQCVLSFCLMTPTFKVLKWQPKDKWERCYPEYLLRKWTELKLDEGETPEHLPRD